MTVVYNIPNFIISLILLLQTESSILYISECIEFQYKAN